MQSLIGLQQCAPYVLIQSWEVTQNWKSWQSVELLLDSASICGSWNSTLSFWWPVSSPWPVVANKLQRSLTKYWGLVSFVCTVGPNQETVYQIEQKSEPRRMHKLEHNLNKWDRATLTAYCYKAACLVSHLRSELTRPQIGGEILVPLLQFCCDISRCMVLRALSWSYGLPPLESTKIHIRSRSLRCRIVIGQ